MCNRQKRKRASHLKRDDQGVLASEEDVHVGDEVVVGDQEQAEHEERGILIDTQDSFTHPVADVRLY